MNEISLLTSRGRFFVRDSGQTNKPTLLLLHGWLESSSTWKSILPWLKDYRVVCPDLRGMGNSERTQDLRFYTKQNIAQDIVAIVDALELNSFFLVGHNWGGVVAQEIALAIPEQVEALCLMNTVIINNPLNSQLVEKVFHEKHLWHEHFTHQSNFPEEMILSKEETWLRRLLRLFEQKPFPKDLLEEYLRTLQIPGTAASILNYYRAVFEYDLPRWQQLIRNQTVIPVNCLYLHGSRDSIIAPNYLQGAEKCFYAFDYIPLEAGHFVHVEKPAEIGTYIAQFLHQQSFVF